MERVRRIKNFIKSVDEPEAREIETIFSATEKKIKENPKREREELVEFHHKLNEMVTASRSDRYLVLLRIKNQVDDAILELK